MRFEKIFCLFCLFVVAVFMASACRAYTDYSFAVTAQVNEVGGAHVVEKSTFNLDTDAEREEFDNYQSLGRTTIADWRKFSKNIRYHFTGSVTNLRIIAAREFDVSSVTASVSMEYDVSSVFDSEKSGSRITRFSLNQGKLSFGGVENKGEISLGNNMKLMLVLPSDAIKIETAPEPGVTRPQRNVLVWAGPIVGKWDVFFEREKPLTTEVTEFFAKSYEELSTWWFLVIIAVLFVVLVAVTLLKGRK